MSINVDRTMPVTETNIAKPERPAINPKVSIGHVRINRLDVQGPTPQWAWKLATLAKQAIARKLKKICPV